MKGSLEEQLEVAWLAVACSAHKVLNIKDQITERKAKFRKSLSVGENAPYRAGVLPNGDIVVHLHVPEPGKPNKLFVLTPVPLGEDGKVREERGNDELD